MEGPQVPFIQETYREKAVRKFKQNPWVPIGAVATCAALITAMVKMRQGDSRSFNRWLRVRVIAQGLTIAAMVGGTYTLGTKNMESSKELEEMERIKRAEEKREEERRGFEERLREAEEAYKVEKAFEEGRRIEEIGSGSRHTNTQEGLSSPQSQGRSWWSGWFGGSGRSS